jgi:multiple sugar transport system ATP-binding protein
MEHDGEDDRLVDVVEPAGSDNFAVNKLGGKQVTSRLRPHFPRTRD